MVTTLRGKSICDALGAFEILEGYPAIPLLRQGGEGLDPINLDCGSSYPMERWHSRADLARFQPCKVS